MKELKPEVKGYLKTILISTVVLIIIVMMFKRIEHKNDVLIDDYKEIIENLEIDLNKCKLDLKQREAYLDMAVDNLYKCQDLLEVENE